MRLVGTLNDEKSVRLLSSILREEKIASSYEKKIDPSTKSTLYYLWVFDEEQADQAKAWVKFYQENPEDPRFLSKLPLIESGPPAAESEPEKSRKTTAKQPLFVRGKKRIPPLTRWVIIICALIFFWNSIQQFTARKIGSIAEELALTPLEEDLLFDFPDSFEKMENLLKENEALTEEDFSRLPVEVKRKFRELQKEPYWQGIYELILNWPKSKAMLKAPLFFDIRKGEIWRVISPVLLHGNLLHILFNMLWLWLLGKQVEERIGFWRYLCISLIIGIISNVSQYLMSGPFFLGYSGIIAGLAGFIWMRQKIAPWEGYPLQKNTILFLVFFIMAMLGLQLISFFLYSFNILNIPLNIANTAHIVGAVTGIVLARIPIFSRGAA
ncbi:MAG: hypothetical protein Tsb0015_03000 [Simkaniaceae bacterium]